MGEERKMGNGEIKQEMKIIMGKGECTVEAWG